MHVLLAGAEVFAFCALDLVGLDIDDFDRQGVLAADAVGLGKEDLVHIEVATDRDGIGLVGDAGLLEGKLLDGLGDSFAFDDGELGASLQLGFEQGLRVVGPGAFIGDDGDLHCSLRAEGCRAGQG